MNDMSNTPRRSDGRIERRVPFATWGLPLNEGEMQANVERVTVSQPAGITTIMVTLECGDGVVCSAVTSLHASQMAQFDPDRAAEIARKRALSRLHDVRDFAAKRREERAAAAGSFLRGPARHGGQR